jgi:hypothetical protein
LQGASSSLSGNTVQDPQLTIVTGASSNHFACLRNLLMSIRLFEPNARVLVFDLGLSASERQQLIEGDFECRRFEFDRYPAHVNIQRNRGEYAWKPIIVTDTLSEGGGMILWLDAGDLIHNPLTRVKEVLSVHGIYTPTSPGWVRDWVYPGTLRQLSAVPGLRNKPNRNGAIVGFNSARAGMMDLASRWKECALIKECIAPAGSARKNHRQDQAILTILAYQFQRRYGFALEDSRLGITVHNDQLTMEEAAARLATTGLAETA